MQYGRHVAGPLSIATLELTAHRLLLESIGVFWVPWVCHAKRAWGSCTGDLKLHVRSSELCTLSPLSVSKADKMPPLRGPLQFLQPRSTEAVAVGDFLLTHPLSCLYQDAL